VKNAAIEGTESLLDADYADYTVFIQHGFTRINTGLTLFDSNFLDADYADFADKQKGLYSPTLFRYNVSLNDLGK